MSWCRISRPVGRREVGARGSSCRGWSAHEQRVHVVAHVGDDAGGDEAAHRIPAVLDVLDLDDLGAPVGAITPTPPARRLCSATSRMRTPCITSVMTAPPPIAGWCCTGQRGGGRARCDRDVRDRHARAVADDVVHQGHELGDLDEAAVHQPPLQPDRTDLDGEVGIPVVGELRHRLAVTAGAVAHGDASEADLRVLGAPRLDHPVERGLAHQVGGEAGPRRRESRADRREVRGGTARFLQVRQRGGGGHRRADHVGVERPSPRRGVEVLDARQRPDAGGVHERVDAPESGRGVRDRTAARRLVGHVTPDRQRARAGFLGRLDQAVVPARQQRDLGPPLRESDADAAPEPAGRSDDDRSHRSPSSTCRSCMVACGASPARTAASTSPIAQVRPRMASSGASSQSTTIRS